MNRCLYCKKGISGRPDKKYCDHHCKSAFQYQTRKEEDAFFFKVDRILKTNRKILKKYNSKGKTILRQSTLIDKGFQPNYFTHYWRNSKGDPYIFCYDFGFRAIQQKGIDKFLLIQWQEYMSKM